MSLVQQVLKAIQVQMALMVLLEQLAQLEIRAHKVHKAQQAHKAQLVKLDDQTTHAERLLPRLIPAVLSTQTRISQMWCLSMGMAMLNPVYLWNSTSLASGFTECMQLVRTEAHFDSIGLEERNGYIKSSST